MAEIYQEKQSKFKIETYLKTTSGDIEDISEYVRNIVEREMYTTAFPAYIINLQAPERIKKIINENDISISFRIYEFNAKNVNDDIISDVDIDSGINEMIMDTEVRIFVRPKTATNLGSVSEDDTMTEDDKDKIGLFNISLYGVSSKAMKVNEKIVNTIYNNSTAIDAMINLITENIKSSGYKIYVQDPDNNEKYSHILVPPMNLIPALNWIETNYAAFASEFDYFFRDNEAYIFSIFKPKVNSFTNKLSVTFTSNENEKNRQNTSIPLVDENNNVKYTSKKIPEMIDGLEISRFNFGANAIFNSYADDFSVIRRTDGRDDNGDKSRYFWNTQNRKIFEHQYEDDTKAGMKFDIPVAINNINPLIFSPFTKVDIYCDIFKDINGEYGISERTTSYSTVNKKDFTATTILTLTKMIY